MEMKYIVGMIIALVVLGVLVFFVLTSHGLFNDIMEWFKRILGI